MDRVSIGTWLPMHVSAKEIDDQILLHGNCGELRRAVRCPCARIDTNTANAACQTCRGVGWVYPETLREPMIFLDHSRSGNPKPQGPGMLSDGTISVTLPCGTTPAKGDLLLPTDDVVVVHEQFHRDVQQVSTRTLADRQVVHGQRSRRLRTRRAALLYPDVVSIDALFWKLGEQLVQGVQGRDFRLVDGAIEWLAGESPAEGEGFSVRYQAPAAYIIHNSMPLFRHEAGNSMPWSVQAQRLDKVQIVADVR